MADALTTNGTFSFELVSPERKLLSEPAKMVIVPGSEGDFGVLPNHSALVSGIRPGVLTVYRDGTAEPMRIFIAGGFADVSPDNLTVLAEEAVLVGDIDTAELEQAIRNLTEDLGMAADADKNRIAARLTLAQEKLRAAQGAVAA